MRLESLSRSTVCFMKVRGSERSERLLSVARCLARSSSRRSETAFMRVPSDCRSSNGKPNVTIVAKAKIAVIAVIRKVRSKRMLKMPTSSPLMAALSMLETDHFFHDQNADCHPHGAAGQHDIAQALGKEKCDISGRGEVDERHHSRRQRADDHRGCLGFRRHRTDLALQPLTVAQHEGKVRK